MNPVEVTIHAAINGRIQTMPLARTKLDSPEKGPAKVAALLRQLADVIEDEWPQYDLLDGITAVKS